MKDLKNLIGLAVFALVLASCNKDELLKPTDGQFLSYRDHCGTFLDVNHPQTVNVNEQFSISGVYGCGRVSLERGYVLAPDNVTRIYVDLTCDTQGLLWEVLLNNVCYTVDFSHNVTLTEDGTYVYRTRHQFNDGNCDGLGGNNSSGNCSFNGTNFCCFEIEAVDACVIESGDYFTYSHGFYLQALPGGTFLEANPALGPVSVGCEDGTITTYSLAEIRAFQPGNSSPPGILAKQIIAMTLNVNASALGLLGLNDDLGCLVVVADGDPLTTIDDLFAGLTVNEIIAAANDYAGGCDTTTYSAGDLTSILEAIVDNFHIGNANLGLLSCCE